MQPRRVALACSFALTACVPAGAAVTDAAPTPAVAASPPSATPPPPSSSPAAPVAPAAHDSKLPAHARIVDAKASSSLVEFVAQLPAAAGLAWLGPLAGNGGREALIYVPPGAAPAAEFVLVYHFHGTHAEQFVAPQPGLAKPQWVGWDRLQQTIDAVGELQAQRGRNVALIYPLSAGKRPEPGHTGWFNKEYDRMWMRAEPPAYTDDFAVLHGETLAILQREFGVDASKLPAGAGEPARGRVIAEGHSAGGIALRNIALSGSPVVDEYLFLDASFQGWADGCHRALREQHRDALVSVVITKGGIADPFGKADPWCETAPRDAETWALHRARCEAGAKRPPGSKKTCAELRTIATDWPQQRPWCEGMAQDMRDVPGVFLLRTRVPHGKQPRHFAGGLELPVDRGGRGG